MPGDAALCRPCDRALPRLAGPPGEPLGGLRVFAAAPYEADVLEWIQRFKYLRPGIRGLDPGAGAVARGLVREAARRAPGRPPDLVAPVPLHPRRLRARGFNPACLLARAVARELDARCDPVALVRLRDTESQTGLSRAARRRNVRRAFAARSAARIPERVFLVDDVVTTGATLAEAARALRDAGAREVIGICAARTPAPAPAGPVRADRRPRTPTGSGLRDEGET